MRDASSQKELIKEGKVAYQCGDYQAAARAFEAARQAYLLVGDALSAAEMANNCSVTYLHAGEAEAALRAVEGSMGIFAQAGDFRRQGMAVGNMAAALEALNRFEEAAQAYQQSADILEKAGEDQLCADALRSLSSLQLRMGRQLQALVTMRIGLEGVRHPSPAQRLTRKLLRIPFDFMNKNKP